MLLISDVQLTTNIDDTDLHPCMRVLPEAKTGWTSIAF